MVFSKIIKAKGTIRSGEIGVAIWQAHRIEIPHATHFLGFFMSRIILPGSFFQVKRVTGAECNGLAAKELSGFVPHVGENISVTAGWAKQT